MFKTKKAGKSKSGRRSSASNQRRRLLTLKDLAGAMGARSATDLIIGGPRLNGGLDDRLVLRGRDLDLACAIGRGRLLDGCSGGACSGGS